MIPNEPTSNQVQENLPNYPLLQASEYFPTQNYPLDSNDVADSSQHDQITKPERKNRRLKVAFVSCLTIFLFCSGVVAGWFAHDTTQAWRKVKTQTPEIIEVPSSNVDSAATMPDLRGLPSNEALTVLSDMGVETAAVKLEKRGWAGAPGQVIEQNPAPGRTELSQMKLVISELATVPKLEGMSRADAEQAIRNLGAEAIFESVFVASKPAGSVLGSDPGEGKPLPQSVKIKISEAGASVFLSEINSIENNCSRHEARLKNQEFQHSLSCYSSVEGRKSVWNLEGKVDLVEFTLGIADDARDASGQVTASVYLDGKLVTKATAKLAAPVPVKFSTSGKQRLEIVVTSSGVASGYNKPDAVLGDAKLIGTTANIDALSANR